MATSDRVQFGSRTSSDRLTTNGLGMFHRRRLILCKIGEKGSITLPVHSMISGRQAGIAFAEAALLTRAHLRVIARVRLPAFRFVCKTARIG